MHLPVETGSETNVSLVAGHVSERSLVMTVLAAEEFAETGRWADRAGWEAGAWGGLCRRHRFGKRGRGRYNRAAVLPVWGRLTQRLECHSYTVEVTGSNPVSPTF